MVSGCRAVHDFEGTSEIQRMVIANALGAAVGTLPLHVVIEPSGSR